MEADARLGEERLGEESEEKPPQETFRPEILPGMVPGIACLGNGHWIHLFLGKHETGAMGNGHVQHASSASRHLEEEVSRRYDGAVSGKGG